MPTTTVAQEPLITVEDQSEPEFFVPAWKKVAIGQAISFATTVIDQDLDETTVIASKLPPSAKFDAVTQTIAWTPRQGGRAEGDVRADDHAAGAQQVADEVIYARRRAR